MGKDLMIEILKTQLEGANATIKQLLMRQDTMTRTIQEQSATIKSLESTIKNLEELLLRKEDALPSAEEQKKALGKLIDKKNEKVKTAFIPKTEEERAEQEKRREVERQGYSPFLLVALQAGVHRPAWQSRCGLHPGAGEPALCQRASAQHRH